MNKLAENRRGDCCITRGVDSGEKTLDTTIGNKCKFSWDSKARRKTLLTKTSAILEKGKLYGDRLRLNRQRRRLYN